MSFFVYYVHFALYCTENQKQSHKIIPDFLSFSLNFTVFRLLIPAESAFQYIDQIRQRRNNSQYNGIPHQRTECRIPYADQHQRGKEQHHQPVRKCQHRYDQPSQYILNDLYGMLSPQCFF